MKRLAILLAASVAVFGGYAEASAAGVDELPADITDYLLSPAHTDARLPLGPSAYRNWKSAKAPPWTFAYVGSARFGSWNEAALRTARDELAPKWANLGLSKALVAPPAAANDSEASRRIRELADEGVDAILVCCASSTGLNDAIAYAHGKGALVVPFFGFSTSPYALNATTNFTLTGNELVDRIAEDLGDKGNVLVVGGFLGDEASQALDRGIRNGFERNSGLKMVGDIAVNGGADASRAATLAWLESHRDSVDGVIVRSGANFHILDAFSAAPRKIPIQTYGDDLASLCYWRHNLDTAYHALIGWPPAAETALAWNVAMRTLQGQGPKIQSVVVDAISINSYDVRTKIPESCSLDGDGWFPAGGESWGDRRFLNYFFLRPDDPTHYKP